MKGKSTLWGKYKIIIIATNLRKKGLVLQYNPGDCNLIETEPSKRMNNSTWVNACEVDAEPSWAVSFKIPTVPGGSIEPLACFKKLFLKMVCKEVCNVNVHGCLNFVILLIK